MQLIKESPDFSDITAWREHCQIRGKQGFPRPLAAMRTVMPALYENLAEVTRHYGSPISDMPQDSECVAETRIPLNQAASAIRDAEIAKNIEEKRQYLEAAKAWLESPHPLQGNQTRKEVESLLADVCASLEKVDG